MGLEQRARAYCKKDEWLFADMRECLNKGDAEVLYADENGVLLFDKPSGVMMFAADDNGAAKGILARFSSEAILEEHDFIVAHGDGVRDAVADRFEIERENVCFQVVYTKKAPLPLKGTLRFKKATEKELPIIQREYDLESPENLARLCAQGKIYCAFLPEEQGGDFVGFIGRHPDGSMGLLLIFPVYRRHGYAEELESYMTNVILAEGRVPYAHIIEDNFKSAALQKKLGFTVANEKVRWCRLKSVK